MQGVKMKKNLHCKTWQRNAVALVSCFVIASPVYANPIGADVVSGVVSMAQQGNTLNITNSPGAIINWQGFSVGANEATRFIQQSASSGVLNRVVGQDPSSILGALQSNGRVFLINPNGVLFGAGAQVDVAGLVVSTLNLSNADFLNGRYNFTANANAGGIENQGSLTALPGGQIYLIAPNLGNSGVITSPQGDVILAAGNSVELVNAGSPDMRVVIDAPNNEVLNLGSIVANSGRVGIYAGLINHHGIVSADTATVGATGKIVFKASRDIALDAGSRIEANGPKGGSVTVQAEGGTLLASGAIEAKGSADKGGEIRLLGDQVGLIGNASIDASGQTGGGSVLIGGDRHGDNPAVQNAWRTYFGPDATVKADAIQSGDGGKVIVWSDDITRFYGNVFARGGANDGNGGFAEVSGKNWLDFAGLVNAGAPNGLAGTLLLDPTNITVVTTGANATATQVDQFADADQTGGSKVSPATLNATGATVVLQATNDITISNAVNLATAGAGFVAQAGNDININAPLTTTGGNIILEADSPHYGASFDGSGMVNINAQVNACGGAAGGCAGGNITLIGGGNSSPTGGFGFSLKANVQAGNGGINVALSQTQNTPALNFFIGAGGNAQLSSNDTGYLLSTGPLVLGRATTAGTDGYGTGAILLLVNSLSQLNASPVALSANSGSTFELFAGAGGIRLDRNLTTFQTTRIDTTGTFTLNAALDTSNHNLIITAASVNLSGGSITTGTGTFACSGTGCPSSAQRVNQWTVDASGDWMIGSNWSLGVVPAVNDVALIDRPAGAYTITLGAAGQTSPLGTTVGLLVNNETLNLAGNALNPTTLNISSALTYNNSTASFNTGTMTLTNSVLNGTGLLNNQGTLNITNSTVAAAINQTAGTLNANGTNLISGGLTIAGGTAFSIASGITTVSGATGVGTYAGSVTIASGANLALTGGNQNLISGSVGGSGNLTVTTAFNQVAGATIGIGGVLDVTQATGDLTVNGSISAGRALLKASAGNIVLNQAVSGTGSGDSVVLVAGGNFVNTAGATPINPGAGRYLIYSTSPAANTFGGFVSQGNLFGRTYAANPPATISAGFGNRFVYSITPTLTVAADAGQNKTYGNADPGSYTFGVTGLVAGDTTGSALTGALTRAAGENVGNYTILQGTLADQLGYTVNYTSSNFGITPAVLNLSGTRPYDGTTAFAAAVFGTSGTIGGVSGETLTLTGAGSVASPLVGSYAVNAEGLTLGNGTGLASNYTLTSGTHTGTITSPTIIEQLVNTQIIQLNYLDNILASSSVLNPVSPIVSAGLLATSAYLETQTGQTMPLSPIFSIDPGVYTNIDTGETTLIQAGATLEPGIYFNQATNTVVVVTLDQNTGQIVMLSGAVSESQVAAGAKVIQMELNACR